MRTLTAALVMAHAVLGCCWHHAHACDDTCHAAVTGEVHHSDHPHRCLVEGACDHSGHQHECLGDRCVFVGGEPPRLPSISSSGEKLPLPLAIPQHFGFDTLESERLMALTCVIQPPERPYLLYQILLI